MRKPGTNIQILQQNLLQKHRYMQCETKFYLDELFFSLSKQQLSSKVLSLMHMVIRRILFILFSSCRLLMSATLMIFWCITVLHSSPFYFPHGTFPFPLKKLHSCSYKHLMHFLESVYL
jgi:hypothetical protein